MLNPIFIKGISLPDVWFQLVYRILEDDIHTFKIDKGSYAGETRKEFDYVTIQIEKPWLRDNEGRPLVPEFPEGCSIPPPVEKDYPGQYAAKYLMSPYVAQGELYTYGSRLFQSLFNSKCQVDRVIDTFRTYGYRNNQMILTIGLPTDLLLDDPPCLRSIDLRIQDNKLHFFPYFRSWSLWGGLPANLAGLSILQEYMAAEIGVSQGEMICSSKGLHLYGFECDVAKARCLKG